MKKLNIKKIQNITGGIMSFTDKNLPQGLLKIGFGFVNGAIPLYVVVDPMFNIIYTNRGFETIDESINLAVDKLRKTLWRKLIIRDKKLMQEINSLFDENIKDFNLRFYNVNNIERLHNAIDELYKKGMIKGND